MAIERPDCDEKQSVQMNENTKKVSQTGRTWPRGPRYFAGASTPSGNSTQCRGNGRVSSSAWSVGTAQPARTRSVSTTPGHDVEGLFFGPRNWKYAEEKRVARLAPGEHLLNGRQALCLAATRSCRSFDLFSAWRFYFGECLAEGQDTSLRLSALR